MSEIAIPKIIFQTSKNKDFKTEYEKYFETHFNDYEYYHFDDADIDKFCMENPDQNFPNIIKKIKNIKRGEHKADLFRLYFLYKRGGIYLDTDAIIYEDIKRYVDNGEEIFLYNFSENHFTNWFICAKQNSSLIFSLLTRLYHKNLDEINTEYYSILNDASKIIKPLLSNKRDKLNFFDEHFLFDFDGSAEMRNEECILLAKHYAITKIVAELNIDVTDKVLLSLNSLNVLKKYLDF